jgi:DNA replication protein DnaC
MFRCAVPGKFLDLSLQYFEKLRSTYNEESGRYGQTWNILEDLSTVPCLAIDDFGVQRNTEWEQEMLYNLVDARYEYERLTLVTTNKPIEEVEELHGGRIYSRLQEMCRVVHVEAPDYRVNFNHTPRRRG